jgi:hypothetical protein
MGLGYTDLPMIQGCFNKAGHLPFRKQSKRGVGALNLLLSNLDKRKLAGLNLGPVFNFRLASCTSLVTEKLPNLKCKTDPNNF